MSSSAPALAPAEAAAPAAVPQDRRAAQAPLLTLDRISVDVDGRRLLEDVTVTVGPGEIVTLVGPNGGGKSTLLRVAIGDVRPSAGAVSRRDGLRIGYMPQKLALDPTLPITAERFLRLAVATKVDRRDALAALERVGATDLAQSQMIGLSGGEFQRVLLARALLRRPDLLVLDEPTQGLDQSGAANLYRLIAELRRETGVAVMLASHDLTVVMAASDTVLCVNGHICCHGAPEDVSSHPEYRALFRSRDAETFALYRHHHDHRH